MTNESSKNQAPNTREGSEFQIPKKLQFPNSKLRRAGLMHFLEFETSDFSGAWCLVFAPRDLVFCQLVNCAPEVANMNDLRYAFRQLVKNPDSGNVVLLSEGLWRDRFGADPAIINQTIQLGERTFTVVGVMAARVKLFDPSSVQFNRCFKGFIAQNCQMVND